MPRNYGSLATVRFTPGLKSEFGVIRATGPLQKLNLKKFMQNINAGTERRRRSEQIEQEEMKVRKWTEARLQGLKARKAREEREHEERIQRREDALEHEKQEKQWRQENAEMWTKPGLIPLAQPPDLTGEKFLDMYMPSDLRFRCLFPNDPWKRCRMKDFMGEFGALHDYTNWAGAMITAPDTDDTRRGFYERLANDASEDAMLVFQETASLLSEANELGRFMFCFCDDDLGDIGLKKRLLEGGPYLEQENGLYSYCLENSDKPQRNEIWKRYGALVPTELERFEHCWLDKGKNTARLEKELMLRGPAVFEGWSEDITKAYSDLLPTPFEMIQRRLQQCMEEHGNIMLVEEQMMLWTDSDIESLGEEFICTYGRLIRPSLERFHHQYSPERIAYIRLWEPQKILEDWGPDIKAAYPPYSAVERFERKYEVNKENGLDKLKLKLLTVDNALDFLQDAGNEVREKYGHLLPSEEEKFEHQYFLKENNVLRPNHIFTIFGMKAFEGWSTAIKEKYLRYAPSDLEQFEARRHVEEIEKDLMLFGESIFDGWDEEVKNKWGFLCPTEEARFQYRYSEETDGMLKANDRLLREGESAFVGWSQEIRDTYSHLLSRSSNL